MHRNRILSAVVPFVLGVALASAASAAPTLHSYGNLSGTNYDFIDVNETVQTADDDPNPLFEAPGVVGDSLIFSPSSFDASASGASDFDDTHSTLNATIMSTSGAFIDELSIAEGGDFLLLGSTGSGATSVNAFLAGTVTVLDALNPGDVGTIITFGGAGSDFEAVFTPGTNFLSETLPPPGSFAWTASVDIDIASIVAGVTKVELQFNNQLIAFSESADNVAQIQKKAVSGPRITVVPEPGTALLLGLGLAGLAIRARRSTSR